MGAAEYTLDDLLRGAANEGLTAKKRLVSDWEELGLIDLCRRHSLGQGLGSRPGTWPEEQYKLFLTVLRKRKEVKKIATLCNVPVWTWLWWGDDYVPLRQVRRAMATWTCRQGRTPESAARDAARQLVSDFGTSFGKAAVVDFITEQLRTRIASEYDWEKQIQRLGPGEREDISGVSFHFTPQKASALLRGRADAIRCLPDYSDEIFEWARFIYLRGRAEYAASQPRLAALPRFGRLFSHEDLSDILNKSCIDLLTVLGLSTATQQSRSGSDDLQDPNTWTERHLRATLSGTRVTSAGLQLEVSIASRSGSQLDA